MKNSFMFIFVFICNFLMGQARREDRGVFGIKTGIAATHVAGTRANFFKAGFEGGIWFRLKLKKKLTAQLEVLFIEKGAGGKRSNYSLRLYYFEVPLLLQYHKEKIIFEFGPGFGYLGEAWEYLRGGVANNLADVDPFLKKEFSFNAGIIYTVNDSWNFGWRYSNSLFPIRRASSAKNQWGANIYNCVFAFTLAHRLKAKKPEHSDELFKVE